MTDRHRTTDPRLDDDDPEVPEPVGPEPREPGDNQTLSSPVNELENRLFGRCKVLVPSRSGRPCCSTQHQSWSEPGEVRQISAEAPHGRDRPPVRPRLRSAKEGTPPTSHGVARCVRFRTCLAPKPPVCSRPPAVSSAPMSDG